MKNLIFCVASLAIFAIAFAKECPAKVFECLDDDPSKIKISDLVLTCYNGYVCNKDNVDPCTPCIPKTPVAEETGNLKRTWNLLPPLTSTNCNDGSAILRPCRVGPTGSYYKCVIAGLFTYALEERRCADLYRDWACRAQRGLCQ